MKNWFILTVCIFCIFLAGCVSTTTEVKSYGEVEQIPLVAKDFIIVGNIYVESTATLDSYGATISGSKVTFEMLMKEAEKLGADDIANLRIDEILTSVKTADPSGQSTAIRRTITYKATAIAIKYIAQRE